MTEPQQQELTLTELRQELSAVLHAAATQGVITTVTQYGRPYAAVVPLSLVPLNPLGETGEVPEQVEP